MALLVGLQQSSADFILFVAVVFINLSPFGSGGH